jgi:hypothetical protein
VKIYKTRLIKFGDARMTHNPFMKHSKIKRRCFVNAGPARIENAFKMLSSIFAISNKRTFVNRFDIHGSLPFTDASGER